MPHSADFLSLHDRSGMPHLSERSQRWRQARVVAGLLGYTKSNVDDGPRHGDESHSFVGFAEILLWDILIIALRCTLLGLAVDSVSQPVL
jgi:hypothetical protein